MNGASSTGPLGRPESDDLECLCEGGGSCEGGEAREGEAREGEAREACGSCEGGEVRDDRDTCEGGGSDGPSSRLEPAGAEKLGNEVKKSSPKEPKLCRVGSSARPPLLPPTPLAIPPTVGVYECRPKDCVFLL